MTEKTESRWKEHTCKAKVSRGKKKSLSVSGFSRTRNLGIVALARCCSFTLRPAAPDCHLEPVCRSRAPGATPLPSAPRLHRPRRTGVDSSTPIPWSYNCIHQCTCPIETCRRQCKQTQTRAYAQCAILTLHSAGATGASESKQKQTTRRAKLSKMGVVLGLHQLYGRT